MKISNRIVLRTYYHLPNPYLSKKAISILSKVSKSFCYRSMTISFCAVSTVETIRKLFDEKSQYIQFQIDANCQLEQTWYPNFIQLAVVMLNLLKKRYNALQKLARSLLLTVDVCRTRSRKGFGIMGVKGGFLQGWLTERERALGV